jgi:hypothetical protein
MNRISEFHKRTLAVFCFDSTKCRAKSDWNAGAFRLVCDRCEKGDTRFALVMRMLDTTNHLVSFFAGTFAKVVVSGGTISSVAAQL